MLIPSPQNLTSVTGVLCLYNTLSTQFSVTVYLGLSKPKEAIGKVFFGWYTLNDVTIWQCIYNILHEYHNNVKFKNGK